MADLTAGHTRYTLPVAKVLVSLPDELLKQVDLRAKALSESRSGYLRALAEADLEQDERRHRQEASRILDEIQAEFREDEPYVDVVELVRGDRDSR